MGNLGKGGGEGVKVGGEEGEVRGGGGGGFGGKMKGVGRGGGGCCWGSC